MPFNPFSQLTSKIYGAIAIAAILVAIAQTARIDGVLCRAPSPDAQQAEKPRCLLQGFRQEVAERDIDIANRTAERDLERARLAQTKQSYAQAQQAARALEEARLARVAAQQQEITHEVTRDYRDRIATARAHAEQLREELRTRTGPAGASGDLDLPGTGGAAGRAYEAASHPGLSLPPFDISERLTATEQAIQLDALIDWIEAQTAVDPNR